MKKKIWLWIFSIFCILAAMTYIPSLSSCVFFILGFLSLPVKPVYKFWKKIPLRKLVKPLFITFFFFMACCIAPSQPDTESTFMPEAYTQSAETSEERKESKETESPDQKNRSGSKEDISKEESTKDLPVAETTQAKEEDIKEQAAEVIEESLPQTETENVIEPQTDENIAVTSTFDASMIPAYVGGAYVVINDNTPFFTYADMIADSYEYYSPLDSLGRCGMCVAMIGYDLMPTQERGEIGSIKPSGWNQAKYMGLVDGNYLYNRCHLIGYQLTGENANEENLITGTRYLNIEGMLPFENMVADYIKETKNHVLYRVTPIFTKDNLLSDGVLLEAKSVEDNGNGIMFCVFSYNVQPGVVINYNDGSSFLDDSYSDQKEEESAESNSEPENEHSSKAGHNTEELKEEETEEQEIVVTPPDEPSSAVLVWLSATGSKYHSINNCGKMNPAKARQVSEQEAISMGMGKCSKCW